MSNVFFGKMKVLEEINNKVYITSDRGYFGEIQVGDFIFVKVEHETNPASVKRLWKVKDISNNGSEWVASFDELFQFEPIQLLKFEALSIFQLDVNLLNKCNKQTKGLSFYRLTIVDENAFDAVVTSKETFEKYISNDGNYRKMVRLDNIESADPNSINVQFYKDGESWNIYGNAPFLGTDLKDNFDSSQFDLFDKYGKKGTGTAKYKMYSFLSGMQVDVPMMGLWDLFCGTVKENEGTTKKKSKSSNKRIEFIEFCKENGVVRAASQYETGVRSLEKALDVDADLEFEKDECDSLKEKIKAYIKDISDEQLGNKRNWIIYITKFVEYKKKCLQQDTKVSLVDDTETVQTTYDYAQAKFCGENKVFYGTPGCGKSYYVENTVLPQEEIDMNSVIRTTFYQDYSNTDFVGQILPQVDGDKVTYEFTPGPFTTALKNAIDNPDEKVALIIEELNRGNAPSIFGDIFQLLDRENGTSRYPIVNTNIQNYLKRECTYDLDYIKLPANMYIYATMNTSDQNVFTLDTAFKRRWKFEKLTNEFLGKDTIGARYVPGFRNVTWRTFVDSVNRHIISHATSLSAEDKQVGKYFVDPDLLMQSMDDYSDDILKEFAYKVFEYLWSDVAKFNRSEWFVDDIKSLDILIYKFVNHENIFVMPLASELPIYVPVEEEE